MCGIAGAVNLGYEPIQGLEHQMSVMNTLQRHRGPDGEGVWCHPNQHAGFAPCQLSIIDLVTGDQPMSDRAGNWITYNSELYNYIELRNELGPEQFISASDIEAILYTYRKGGIGYKYI